MTTDDIIKLARQIWGEQAILPVGGLVTFFHAAQAMERDACAKVCDELWTQGVPGHAKDCANAIRNRSAA